MNYKKYKYRNALTIGFLVLLLFTACRNDINLPYGSKSLITGLASPIVLQPDTTVVALDDYFDILSEIEEISPPEGIQISTGKAGELQIIATDQTPGLSLLKVRSKSNHVYDLLLKRSAKKKLEFTFDGDTNAYTSVHLVGDMNAWNAANSPLLKTKKGWTTKLWLEPGQYAYQLELDGKRALDPNAPARDNGMGGSNSVLTIDGPQGLAPYIVTDSASGKTITISNQGEEGQIIVFWENSCIADTLINKTIKVTIPREAEKVDRSHIRAYVFNEDGGRGNDILIPLNGRQVVTHPNQLSRSDLHGQIMYFLMVDRFMNGESDNDRPEDDPSIHPLANFKGGDLQGVLQKLKEGYFDSLGINTLWLSPIPKNPKGAYGLWDKGGVKSTFSAYHGYWPIGLSDVDQRFGNKAVLQSLIDQLHATDKNLILDFVAHHIHEEHNLYREKKDENWFTDLYLEDSTLNTERWDDQRLTTWFDVFLPTFNFFNPEVNEALSDTAMYWVEEFDIDGFRHDATKHVHLDFWRTLTKKIKTHTRSTGLKTFQIGETYGTPELIASYISTGLLDAQFDFNLFDAAIAAFCKTSEPFDHLKSTIEQSLSYYGYNHLMGHMSGNQDRARFMSYATGDIRFDEDAKYAGWTRDIELKTNEGYRKLAQMHAFNLTMPGIPCIYYGDEIGLTGGNDPDNRRMMYFDNWNNEEHTLFNKIQTLCNSRKNNLALLYGDLKVIDNNDKNVLIYQRQYLDYSALLVFNNSDSRKTITIPNPSNNNWFNPFFETEVSAINNNLEITVEEHGFKLLLQNPSIVE